MKAPKFSKSHAGMIKSYQKSLNESLSALISLKDKIELPLDNQTIILIKHHAAALGVMIGEINVLQNLLMLNEKYYENQKENSVSGD